jgi:phosphoribosylaminoimidazolecarboxamide formyltransferase/IMP cyclohydrolase
MKQLWGKELSFNNILDLQSAVAIVREFDAPAVAFIKHNNPCGVAQSADICRAYKDAWGCDTLSAFGGIVSINRPVDLKLAGLISRSGFLECIIAPAFSPDALAVLKGKKNVRVMELKPRMTQGACLDFKKIEGGILLQDADALTIDMQTLKVVTKKKPSKADMESLVFAWKVAKHVKSNAIVLARGTKTVGIGAGQMSRVDSVFIATKKAAAQARGAVLASDAFFPKEDAITLAAKYKIRAIIQPGGSIADEAIIAMADKRKIPMVFTGIRHFRH